MTLSNLRSIYAGMKNNGESYYIFEFVKNKVVFEVLFDIYYSPFVLHFLQKDSNFSFNINVEQGFVVNPILKRELYSKLCNILNLKYDPNNRFSPKSFFEEFNDKIPVFKHREKKERELLPYYKNQIEDSQNLFYGGTIPWNNIGNGKNLTSKNLEKTRILYPELYEWCKRENVSIIYVRNKKKNENDLINKNMKSDS
ncbi:MULTISPECIES: DUF6037 family protein [unclassified Chryseobacterium]|uniref:DUF6037 family protein n=1 Tax=unclassified Chryseobacterium TaxID=2593645 RepID=UPI000D3CB964|nr:MULTISPECIES: DUF6037 family protein [unclassified Chryseobacterium]PTT73795.1 hypothetical protein DBR25_12175 [Chryseobacterium sp. HMWF001]PVV50780.1 hypothetical protein DD829_21490 [Chryseobacterium sp. HMWF035]